MSKSQQKLNLDGKQQTKEGNTYKSGIGLNLDPNNSTKLIQEFVIISLKISSKEMKNFETCIPGLRGECKRVLSDDFVCVFFPLKSA